MIKITPLGKNILFKIEKARAGILDTSSRSSAVEHAEVVATGDEVTIKLKAGDKAFVKAWAVDIIDHEDEKYYFANENTDGILAKYENVQ